MDISGSETNAMDIGENQSATNENIIPDAPPQDFFGRKKSCQIDYDP